MGYILHHTIVITSCQEALLKRAHKNARHCFGKATSPLTPPTVNGYRSFFIAPDGSKEGWSESDDGDRQRVEFKAWLHSLAYEDGSTSLAWFEASYSSDDRAAKVTNHAWEKMGKAP